MPKFKKNTSPFMMKGFSGFGNSPLKKGSEMQFDVTGDGHVFSSYSPDRGYKYDRDLQKAKDDAKKAKEKEEEKSKNK